MLDIEHLQVQYGSIIALRDLSIRVETGDDYLDHRRGLEAGQG
jgi:ABC-type uncharacterized transport system ATPase subunit